MKKALTAFLSINAFLLSTMFIPAQDIQWNNAPGKGFVFEISNKEAQKLLSLSTSDTIFNGLLHTRIDTFDVEKGWINRPSKGHFILARIVENKLHCEYTCVFPYQVFLFKEYDALALQVLDLEGNVREDAKVKFKHRRLRIDPESKTYRLENQWVRANDRITTVELEGFRSVFHIQKHEVPSWYQNYNNDEGPAFYSYMITDKNKYKPNERVRFKSYALSRIKSALRKELEVWVNTYRKSIKVGNVSPHRPGSYAGEFQLHDSLKLILDKDYYLQLREKNGRIVADCSFRYEDYELFGNKLKIQLATSKQFYPEKNQLTIIATDVNGLMLKDAKANILVKTYTIQESFQPLVVLPDTLLFHQIDLDPGNPTQVDIPSDLFQKTNTIYQVVVKVLNSQNQRMESMEMATHFYSQYELTTRFSNDSICFDLLRNGMPMENVPIELRFDGELHGQEVRLPHKEKLNPATTTFDLKNDLISKQITLSHLSPELKLLGGIEKDSFNIQLYNPQQLEISWYIYQGSQLLKKGFGKELDYKSLIEDRTQTFYIELLYSFGGQEHVKRSQYVFREGFLHVSLNIPERIYPGQEVDATIQVSNQLGQPVRGVDLTALAVTSKLNYYLPDLPYYGTSSSPRSKRAHYSKRDLNKRTAVLDLDYQKWEKYACLDTMLYYQLTYPRVKYFKYAIDISDSTQFAPYVMQNGRAKEVFVIEVNRRPVYYSWTDQPREYSFYVPPGKKQEISLRLHDRVLVLDSISFEAGKKTILSFDLDYLPKSTKVYKLDSRLSETERSRHFSYLSAFKKVSNKYAYLESENEFNSLFGEQNTGYSYNIISGPIAPGRKTYVESGGLKTTYQHSGGYSYVFEDNLVYKLNVSNLLPDYLKDKDYNPMKNINDRVMTKKHFLKLQEEKPYTSFNWHARTIDVVDRNSRMKIFLPYEKEASGIAALLFEDCQSKNKVSPYYNNYYRNRSDFFNIPVGCNNAIVLYSNGTYYKMDSIHLKQHMNVAIDMNYSMLHAHDSLSQNWLLKYSLRAANYYKSSNEIYSSRTFYNNLHNTTGNVKGVVFDEENGPLPGATIFIKGTQTGTITDIDGQFTLQIDDNTATLVISFVGYGNTEIEVTRGSEVRVQLVPDMLALDEVVVIAYGTISKQSLTGSVSIVTGENLSALDDEIDTEESNKEDEIIRESEQRLYQELLTLNSIRSNFSDVGFWEPRLYTDKQGESRFRVTFPDDITQWDAVVYAMNRNLQTGTAREKIKSYKPLMAELHVPRFLTRGDSALFLGKVLNYTTDSIIQGQVQWSGANTNFEKDIEFNHFYTDKLPVNVISTDSITARYVFTRSDGYLDGEERTVPVVEQGIIRAEGTLSILQNEENRHVKASDNETITVEILDNQVEIYGQEVRYLLNYRYACNEQLASKLIGLVNHKILLQYEDKKFKYDKDINKIIGRLLKNQNKEFLWSWWNVSGNTSYWMSSHILRALKYAKDAGYKVDLNIKNIASKAGYKFDFLHSYSLSDVDLLHSIAGWNAELDYPKYINKLDSIISAKEYEDEYKDTARTIKNYNRYSFLKEKLLLQEIRQITGMELRRDTLLKYKKDGILGEVFFSDNKHSPHWYDNDLSVNIIAYRIVKNDSLLKHLRVPMQMYFLSSRKNRGWNTYQSSNILMSVLPDLIAEGFSKGLTATVTINGKENRTITRFPYHVELQPNEELYIRKESGLPLFCQQYTKERITKAKTGVEGFAIKTYFNNNSMMLKAGEPVELIVEVEVKKETFLEHVMIEVPIPGACSYADKRQMYYGVETHREYFKERTVIFCEKMKPGKHRFVIHLQPRFTGKYLINPAQVSLMYIPVVNANTDIKQVEVNDRE